MGNLLSCGLLTANGSLFSMLLHDKLFSPCFMHVYKYTFYIIKNSLRAQFFLCVLFIIMLFVSLLLALSIFVLYARSCLQFFMCKKKSLNDNLKLFKLPRAFYQRKKPRRNGGIFKFASIITENCMRWLKMGSLESGALLRATYHTLIIIKDYFNYIDQSMMKENSIIWPEVVEYRNFAKLIAQTTVFDSLSINATGH